MWTFSGSSDISPPSLDFKVATFDSLAVIGRIGKLVVIAALVATTGAHWTVLQTVAWTTMLADNLHSSSLPEALVKTFDGKHPCRLCKTIAAGKKSEKKSEAIAPGGGLHCPVH